MTQWQARMQVRKSRHPVRTILPEAKSRTVELGSDMRMVTAANFFFSNVLLGMMLCMRLRSSGVELQKIMDVPTTLCTMAVLVRESSRFSVW